MRLLHGLQVSELRQRADDLDSQLLSKHRSVENMAKQLTLLREGAVDGHSPRPESKDGQGTHGVK